MVCAYIRKGNLQALGSGLSRIHTHSHIITFLGISLNGVIMSKTVKLKATFPLNLKAPPIFCSRRKFQFLPLFKKTNKA